MPDQRERDQLPGAGGQLDPLNRIAHQDAQFTGTIAIHRKRFTPKIGNINRPETVRDRRIDFLVAMEQPEQAQRTVPVDDFEQTILLTRIAEQDVVRRQGRSLTIGNGSLLTAH